ncbi:MAG: FtsX-like permease family protein [Chloroflexi bacterium]|nr:FtsX-like permease family protein [Chloroflexota bacterium]
MLRVPWLSFAAAFAILLCFAQCSPSFCAVGGRLLRAIGAGRRGSAVRVAAAFLLASLERVWVVVAALSAAIAMLVALSVMVGSFRQTVDQWVGQTVRGDVYISPAAGRVSGSRATLPNPVVSGAARLPGAALVDAYRYIVLSDQGDEIIIGARHAAVMLARPGYRVRRGSTRAALMDLSLGDQALVSGVFADRRRLSEGDHFSLDTPRGRVRFRVAGIFDDYTSDQGLVVFSLEEYRRLWNDSSINSLAVYARPGVSPGDLARQAEAAFPGYQLVIRTNGELKRIILAIFDQTFRVTYVLELIAVLVALLGIASTLMTLTVQRQRQLAAIRALGATRKQIGAVVMVEAAVIAAVAWALGSLCGTALAAELVYVVLPGFFHWTVEMAISPGIFLESLALMMPASLVAAIAPAAAATKVEVSRALRME